MFVGGCAQGLSQQQRAWFTGGKDCYARKDYARAVESLGRFLIEVREGREAAEALYIRGMSNAQLGRRQMAYVDLRTCAQVAAGRPDMAAQAYVVLGTLHFEDEQWGAAAQSYRAAADRLQNTPPKDHVLFRLGICRERLGQWRLALGHYAELTRLFSSGQYVKPALRRLDLRADYFAVQCGAFRTQTNARNLVTDLTRKGLNVNIREETRGRTPLYVVLAGRYENYDDARGQLEMIKKNFVPDALLWP